MFFFCSRIEAASNIVFSNGDLDPWIGGGVVESISDSLIAVVIAQGAHHLDLRSPNDDDPESVVKARRLHLKLMRKWIREASHYRGRVAVA